MTTRIQQHRSERKGFNLIELLTVIGTLGIIIGLSLPAVQQARESAARAACLNNLRQVGTALLNHESSHGRLPPDPIQPGIRIDANDWLSWMALILPDMGEDPLWTASMQACQSGAKPIVNPPHIGLVSVIRSYVCPDDGRLLTPLTDIGGVTAAYTSYIGISSGAHFQYQFFPGVFYFSPGIPLLFITDGTSQTIMVGERPPPNSLQAGVWYPNGTLGGPPFFQGPNAIMPSSGVAYPGDVECSAVTSTSFGPGRLDNPCDRLHLWSLHPGGGNFLFADGSARFLPYAARSTLDALASIQGGEVIDDLY